MPVNNLPVDVSAKHTEGKTLSLELHGNASGNLHASAEEQGRNI